VLTIRYGGNSLWIIGDSIHRVTPPQ